MLASVDREVAIQSVFLTKPNLHVGGIEEFKGVGLAITAQRGFVKRVGNVVIERLTQLAIGRIRIFVWILLRPSSEITIGRSVARYRRNRGIIRHKEFARNIVRELEIGGETCAIGPTHDTGIVAIAHSEIIFGTLIATIQAHAVALRDSIAKWFRQPIGVNTTLHLIEKPRIIAIQRVLPRGVAVFKQARQTLIFEFVGSIEQMIIVQIGRREAHRSAIIQFQLSTLQSLGGDDNDTRRSLGAI